MPFFVPPLCTSIPHSYFTPFSSRGRLYVKNLHLGKRTLLKIPSDEPVGTGGRQRVLIAVQAVVAAHNRLTGFVTTAAAAAARAAPTPEVVAAAQARALAAAALPTTAAVAGLTLSEKPGNRVFKRKAAVSILCVCVYCLLYLPAGLCF